VTVRLGRAEGAVSLDVALRAGQSRIVTVGQAGCLKLRFPRVDPASPLEAIMVNISGGIVAGDHLRTAFAVGAEAALCVSSQAAERCYRARQEDRPATIRTHLTVAERGRLEWLPQETIVFDEARLDRVLQIDMESSARLLAVEALAFGRIASGEVVRLLSLRDQIRIVRDGRPIFDSRMMWSGPVGTAWQRDGLAAGASHVATVLHVAPDASRALEAVRSLIAHHAVPGVRAAASCWNGMLVVRLLSRQDLPHRALLVKLLCCLRDMKPLPRVWQL